MEKNMENEDLVPTTNGKDPKTGKFLPGHKLSKGNPHIDKVAHFRNLLYAAATDEEVNKVFVALIEKAQGGHIGAIKELFNRLGGKPQQQIEITGDGNQTYQVRLIMTEKEQDNETAKESNS